MTHNENNESNKNSVMTETSPQQLAPSYGDHKQIFQIQDINITNGFAGETLCSILRQLQQDNQTLINLQKSKKNWICFLESMSHIKKWSSTVIFDYNKCHLDEDVLRIATIH